MKPELSQQISIRMRQAIDYCMGNWGDCNKFCIKYGINYSNLLRTLREYETRSVQPDWIAAIVLEYNVSADWILTGRGEMMSKNNVIPIWYQESIINNYIGDYQNNEQSTKLPAGSPKEKPKGDNKKTSPTKSIFCGTFLLLFGDPDRQKEGIDGQKLVPHSYPLKVVAGEAVDFCLSTGTL